MVVIYWVKEEFDSGVKLYKEAKEEETWGLVL